MVADLGEGEELHEACLLIGGQESLVRFESLRAGGRMRFQLGRKTCKCR